MISGPFTRRQRALAWSTLASAVIHLILLTLLFYAAARVLIPRGSKETISQTNPVSIEHIPRATPAPPRKHVVRVVKQQESAPARTPRRELARVVHVAAPALPPSRPRVESKIERDQAGFSKEVAQLNRQNDIHAIPTIDPGSQESSTKSYDFAVPSSLRGSEHGNGIITPTDHWHENGEDCYYGRYEYTYPDGAMEDGNIAWPFCYDPRIDPFKLPPHPIPFPLPLPGYKLPPATQLPPIEKSVYDEWAVVNGGSSP